MQAAVGGEARGDLKVIRGDSVVIQVSFIISYWSLGIYSFAGSGGEGGWGGI